MEIENFFLGFDIGTDSVGYAVTDTSDNYRLLKYHGDPMWGSTVFDPAESSKTRRAPRTDRRRLDRRQQRVALIQEIFAKAIAEKDERFFLRIRESALLRTDAAEPYCLFNDPGFTDRDYHKKYPTIHHLIYELTVDPTPHDVRLVYIACAWLVAHRGHFLKEISANNIEEAFDFKVIYNDLLDYFKDLPFDEDYIAPWNDPDFEELQSILKKQIGVKKKTSELINCLFEGKKPSKNDSYPVNRSSIVNLLAGGSVKLKDLYNNEEYDELGSFELGKSDEDYDAVLRDLGDDGELLLKLKAIYDWTVLSNILGDNNNASISGAKINDYNKHQSDLKQLKYFTKKYLSGKYNEIFRTATDITNYVAYSKNVKSVKEAPSEKFKSCNQTDFCKYILSLFKNVSVDQSDQEAFDKMKAELELGIFMPKQVSGENRVIPYQIYYAELSKLLSNAEKYLSFLAEKDASGYTNTEKILSVMKFRVPYFVGPLNAHSPNAWIQRKAEGKITPWNFEEKVDLDKSENEFIRKMTNKCTYLPGEFVLPKHSLLYEKFEVLNEINNITVNDVRISAEAKQGIYNDLFLRDKKVTVKKIKDYLVQHNYCTKADAETLRGIDVSIKSSLSSHIAFRNLLQSGKLSAADVEAIIERSTFSESKTRLRAWLNKEYPKLPENDKKYIASLKYSDFGRLSKKLLCEIYGAFDNSTGECVNIIDMMWQKNVNLMELLSDRYEYMKLIEAESKEYYSENSRSLNDRLDDMYVSNAVKRPIFRTLEIADDVVKVCGKTPAKIFIEMARGAAENQKHKRTVTRKQQLLNLYQKVKDEDVRLLSARLEAMGDDADNRLQSEVLFLYYLQLGKCAYSGENIDIDHLTDGTYNVDHIYPQAAVKDDSILNNKVLVLSTENEAKGDNYPIKNEIRSKMHGFWERLHKLGLMTDEKYKRLTRAIPFSDDEKFGFINRQLVETRQSTKAVAEILKEKYPDTEIVYVKAGLVSDFRHDFDMLKSRSVNDLHHAKDAYLNIVCGNVYNSCFTKKWFLQNKDSKTYTANPKTLFTHPHTVNGTTIWNGKDSIAAIKKTMANNHVHYTMYPFCRKGEFFDQQPKNAASATVPRKANLPVEKYGGYCKPSAAFFVLVRYTIGKKKELMIVPMEILYAEKFRKDKEFAVKYAQAETEKINGKPVSSFELLLDGRILKIGTVFELNGLRAALCSKSNGGNNVGFKPLTPLILSPEQEKYIKHLESFCEKISKNSALKYSEKYDTVNNKDNIALYDTLLQKLQAKPFMYRPENQSSKIEGKEQQFAELTIKEQCTVLMNILSQFNRMAVKDTFTGAQLSCRLSSKLSNWKKTYTDVRIIDTSASGLYETKSGNLLELI